MFRNMKNLPLMRKFISGGCHCISSIPLPACRGLATTAACANAKVWDIGKINHVAIAVPDIDKATAFYRDVLGAKVSEKHAQPEHGVYTVFIELGDTKLELLHPYGDKSPIANFLEKNKSGGMHHICLEVNDIKAAMKDLQANNIRTLGSEPKIGAHNRPVIFLHPKDCNGVLTELEEVVSETSDQDILYKAGLD